MVQSKAIRSGCVLPTITVESAYGHRAPMGISTSKTLRYGTLYYAVCFCMRQAVWEGEQENVIVKVYKTAADYEQL